MTNTDMIMVVTTDLGDAYIDASLIVAILPDTTKPQQAVLYMAGPIEALSVHESPEEAAGLWIMALESLTESVDELDAECSGDSEAYEVAYGYADFHAEYLQRGEDAGGGGAVGVSHAEQNAVEDDDVDGGDEAKSNVLVLPSA